MTNNIYQPDHLLKKWEELIIDEEQNVDLVLYEAFQAGADQELEACCEWFIRDWTDIETADRLRAARRPKPPSLKEQALEMLENAWEGGHINNNAAQTIRRALEQLDDNV